MASILGFLWLGIHNTPSLFFFSTIFGFFAGAITTVTAVVDAALCPTLDVIGVRMGMLFLPWAAGLLIGEPIAGAILDASGDWISVQIFTGSVLGAATVLGVAVRWTKYGTSWRRRC